MEIILHLSTAMICFLGSCHPALVGVNTPVGTYTMTHYKAEKFGGDVLVFYEDDKHIYSLHRLNEHPTQDRLNAMISRNPEDRKGLTDGGINVAPNIYEKLTICCSKYKLVIKQD